VLQSVLFFVLFIVHLHPPKMITPRFECQQTEESIIIKIYCPSIRVRNSTSSGTPII
jgi:hypothetical protein